MLTSQKNEQKHVYILFAHHDIPKLTCLIAKSQKEAIELLQEIAWRSYGI